MPTSFSCCGVRCAPCRFYEVEEPGTFLVGRIAVRKPYRAQGLGAILVQEAESHAKKAGAKRMLIHAQNQAVPFYQKQGYLPTGKTDEEQGCPIHGWKKPLPDRKHLVWFSYLFRQFSSLYVRDPSTPLRSAQDDTSGTMQTKQQFIIVFLQHEKGAGANDCFVPTPDCYFRYANSSKI